MILHVDTGRDWRGGQQQVFLLHRELSRRAVPSTVLARRSSALHEACERHDLAARALPGGRPWHLMAPSLADCLESCTVLHAHDSPAASMAAVATRRWKDIRVVCHRRLSYPLRSGHAKRWKYRLVSRWIAVSHDVADQLCRVGVSSEFITTIPSAIDVDSFRAQAVAADQEQICADFGIPRNAPIVGLVGALVRQKGHAVFFAAAERIRNAVPDVHFLIVGDGRLRRKLQKNAADRGLAAITRFTGFREDVAALTSLFTVAVVPSIDGEGSPASLKEAMCLGSAVVASALPCHEVILGSAGVLTPIGDAERLAEAVIALLADPARRRSLGDRAAAAVAPYLPEVMAASTENLYRQIVLPRGSAL